MEPPLLPVRVLHSEPALGKIRALVATSEGPLWAGGDAGMVVEYGFEGLPLRRFHAHKGGVTCLAVAKGKLLSGGNDGHVRIWSTETLACLSQLPMRGKRIGEIHVDVVQGVGWAIARNGSIAMWRLDGEPVPIYHPPGTGPYAAPPAMAGMGDVTCLAGRDGNRSGLLLRWSASSPEKEGTWRLPYAVACLTFWRGEGTLYAGGNGRLFAIDLPQP